MMNAMKLALAGLALTSAASMAQECAQPETPSLPDGASASLEQMLEGQAAVKAYMLDWDNFNKADMALNSIHAVHKLHPLD